MTPDEEPPERKMDIFEIGINVIEVAVIAAILLCDNSFPMPGATEQSIKIR